MAKLLCNIKFYNYVLSQYAVCCRMKCFYKAYKIRCRPNNFFFGKCFKKQLLNIFSNFYFYLKVQSFRLIMETNFIQMTASAWIVCSCISPMATRILSLACRLLRHPTNNSPTVSNRSSEVAKRLQLCD